MNKAEINTGMQMSLGPVDFIPFACVPGVALLDLMLALPLVVP